MKKINMAIMAHVDAGKTTICEHLLYKTGAIRQKGSVDKGTAHTDFLQMERERGISVKAAVTAFSTDKAEFNLIDTPGHVDFSAEVERSLSVCDAVVLVISAVEGIQAHTEIIWKALDKKQIPVIIAINKIDRKGSRVDEIIEEIKERFTNNVCVITQPVDEGESFAGIEKAPLCESAAEYDDELLDEFLNGKEDEEKAYRIISDMTKKAKVYPIVCMSALNNTGIDELIECMTDFFPDANEAVGDTLGAFVFKIEHDKMMGKVAHVRLYGGEIKNRDQITIKGKDAVNKVVQIRKFHGEKYEDVGFLKGGDIGAVCGLSDVKVGDIIGDDKCVPYIHKWVEPLLRVSVNAVNSEQRQALIDALIMLDEEDPLLSFSFVKENDELTVYVTGIIQNEFLQAVLKDRFGIETVFGQPSVIYKETPVKTAIGIDRYTMPKPCWAVLHFEIEPLPLGSGIVYESKVKPNLIPYRYQNHVEISVPKSLKQGNYGFEVTDIKVTLFDGGYHEEHTHPLDFFVCTPMALAKALNNAGTRLLEPMVHFVISADEEYSGKIIGEIINKRGKFDSPEISGGRFMIEGEIPVATSLDLAENISSLTRGSGVISTTFSGYDYAPDDVEASVPRKGVDPLDRSKFILWSRNALGEFGL